MSDLDEVIRKMQWRQKIGNALLLVSLAIGVVLLLVVGFMSLRHTYSQCMKEKREQGYTRTDADEECTEKVMEMLDL